MINKAVFPLIILTGDKDSLMIKKYASSKILSPRQFWETVKKQTDK